MADKPGKIWSAQKKTSLPTAWIAVLGGAILLLTGVVILVVLWLID